jgi:hypothetical protein
MIIQTLSFVWEHLPIVVGTVIPLCYIIFKLESRVEKLEKLIKEKENGKEEDSKK